MKRSKIITFSSVIITIAIVAALLFYLNKRHTQHQGQLTYASGEIISEAPVHIASKRGLFKKEHLKVDLKMVVDGKTALNKLFDGEVNLAGVMATPVVKQSFTRQDFSIIAVIEHPQFHGMLVNADNILVPQDLINKKIGVTQGTSAEYFMQTFLLANNLTCNNLTLFYGTGPELVEAFMQEEIDAMFSWEPYLSMARHEMGAKAVALPSQRFVHPSWLIVGMNEYITTHPDEIRSFLQGLRQGISNLRKEPEELIDHYQKTTYKNLVVPFTKEDFQDFQLSLQHELLIDLENQARWEISHNGDTMQKLPNYLNFVHTQAMKEVAPSSTTLIK